MTGSRMVDMCGIGDILHRYAESAPSSTALIIDGHEHSFGEVADAAEQLSASLIPSTRVLVRIGNDAGSIVAIHAAWMRGCSVVSASTTVPPAEADRRIKDSGAATVLTPAGDNSLDVQAESTGSRRLAPDCEALVMFTSGTTGVPKGASLTFSALRGSVAGIATGSGIADGGRAPATPARSPQLVIVPIAHMGGFLGVLSTWWLGKPVLLQEKFSLAQVLQLTQQYRLGVLKLTPAMVWEFTQIDGAAELPGVTSVTVGTAALPEATRLRFEKRFALPILRNYGQTEFAGAIAFERPDDVAAGVRPHNTVGRVAPGVEVLIVDTDGGAVGNGQVGEITARAVSAMSGYLDADGTPTNPGIWMRTGDLGVLDDRGFLSVVGRVRDMVVCGGFNIYPAQVEAALNELAAVADSAVAGIADERLGEIPVAAVVLHPGAAASAEDIRSALRSRLAAYELPRKVAVVTRVPRLETGKVDRDAVVRLFAQGQP